jgi:hypothetical protein
VRRVRSDAANVNISTWEWGLVLVLVFASAIAIDRLGLPQKWQGVCMGLCPIVVTIRFERAAWKAKEFWAAVLVMCCLQAFILWVVFFVFLGDSRRINPLAWIGPVFIETFPIWAATLALYERFLNFQ